MERRGKFCQTSISNNHNFFSLVVCFELSYTLFSLKVTEPAGMETLNKELFGEPSAYKKPVKEIEVSIFHCNHCDFNFKLWVNFWPCKILCLRAQVKLHYYKPSVGVSIRWSNDVHFLIVLTLSSIITSGFSFVASSLIFFSLSLVFLQLTLPTGLLSIYINSLTSLAVCLD